MSEAEGLRQRLKVCPPGKAGWQEFEDTCLDTLRYLFVPPLRAPIVQARTYLGTERRDAIMPNWNFDMTSNWGQLRKELSAKLILCEFKNYDLETIGPEETLQTSGYLHEHIGKLAFMFCSKTPAHGAHLKRNIIFTNEKKVILFITMDRIIEMLSLREQGGDPSDVIIDLINLFHIQHQ